MPLATCCFTSLNLGFCSNGGDNTNTGGISYAFGCADSVGRIQFSSSFNYENDRIYTRSCLYMGTDYNQITGTRIKGIHTGNIYIVGGEWVQVSQDSYGVVFEYKNYTIDYSELQTIIDSLPAGVCLGMINSNDSIYRTFYMSGIDNRFEKVTPNPSRVGYYHNNIPDPIPLPKLVFPFTYYSSYLEPEQ